MTSAARALLRRTVAAWNMDESRVIHSVVGSSRGTLFEVGAHTGDDTFMAFVSDGWDVHAFEPDATNREALKARVGDRANVTVVPKAVSDRPGIMTLYTSEESTGISSLAPFTDGHTPSVEVEVTTLSDYVASTGVAKIDYLKVDVEGYERFVLEGLPWATHRPGVILLEFEDGKTKPLGYGWSDLADDLTSRGYEVLVSEWRPIVRYGTLHRWHRLADYPCQLRDPQAWGNLIAVDSERADAIRKATQGAARKARVIATVAQVRQHLSGRASAHAR